MSRKRNFRRILEKQWAHGHFVCVGLDSEFGKIPNAVEHAVVKRIRSGEMNLTELEMIEEIIVHFNTQIIDATKDIVCAYKLNLAFYAEHGPNGISALERTIAYIQEQVPTNDGGLSLGQAVAGRAMHERLKARI